MLLPRISTLFVLSLSTVIHAASEQRSRYRYDSTPRVAGKERYDDNHENGYDWREQSYDEEEDEDYHHDDDDEEDYGGDEYDEGYDQGAESTWRNTWRTDRQATTSSRTNGWYTTSTLAEKTAVGDAVSIYLPAPIPTSTTGIGMSSATPTLTPPSSVISTRSPSLSTASVSRSTDRSASEQDTLSRSMWRGINGNDSSTSSSPDVTTATDMPKLRDASKQVSFGMVISGSGRDLLLPLSLWTLGMSVACLLTVLI